MQKYRFTRIL